MVDVISMPSANLMASYLGKEYQPNRPLSNWVRYWQHPGYEIDYLYLKEHLGSDEKGRADIMFSPWMIIRELLSLRGERWYKNDIYRGKLLLRCWKGSCRKRNILSSTCFWGLRTLEQICGSCQKDGCSTEGFTPLLTVATGTVSGEKPVSPRIGADAATRCLRPWQI